MSLRDKALEQPGRPESQVFALIYVGDQIGNLIREIGKISLTTVKNVVQPAKDAPEPAMKAKTTKKEPVHPDPFPGGPQ